MNLGRRLILAAVSSTTALTLTLLLLIAVAASAPARTDDHDGLAEPTAPRAWLDQLVLADTTYCLHVYFEALDECARLEMLSFVDQGHVMARVFKLREQVATEQPHELADDHLVLDGAKHEIAILADLCDAASFVAHSRTSFICEVPLERAWPSFPTAVEWLSGAASAKAARTASEPPPPPAPSRIRIGLAHVNEPPAMCAFSEVRMIQQVSQEELDGLLRNESARPLVFDLDHPEAVYEQNSHHMPVLYAELPNARPTPQA